MAQCVCSDVPNEIVLIFTPSFLVFQDLLIDVRLRKPYYDRRYFRISAKSRVWLI